MPLFDVDDTGKFVCGILLQQSKLLGERVFGATDWYTPQQVIETIEKVSGKKAAYQALSNEVFKSILPPVLAEELTETLIFIKDYAYFGPGAEQGLTESLQVTSSTPKIQKTERADKIFSDLRSEANDFRAILPEEQSLKRHKFNYPL